MKLVGIDIGGTFTDAVAVFPDGVRIAKVPSDREEPEAAVLAAVDALALPGDPDVFRHGTTLVTNMLLEHRGAPTGFLTSRGMRDLLHIGRHERPLNYSIRQEIPRQHFPPVPRRFRRTVPERVASDGAVITPLDEQAVRQAARELVAEGVRAIAVGFLHAYLHPEHERRAVELVREEAPEVFVCASHEVSPRFREYERFLTTAWNARVAPGAAEYLSRLSAEVEGRWSGVRMNLMTSNGGLEEEDLRRTPIRLALSGPAAAGNAVARLARELELPDCVGLDVGGTSSDIVVVRGSRLHEAPQEERRVGGYPLQTPMLDLHTIGAGGGSLVRPGLYGTIHVGPESAGAVPGPACYGQGGTRPTVTDAAAVAGRLPEAVALGGNLPIDADRARAVFADSFEVEDEAGIAAAALRVLALAEAKIAFAIRERTVSRGLDPAGIALVAAGGAGPMLACGVAEALELAEVIVPPRPGLLAAWGLLAAPERREAVATVLEVTESFSGDRAEELFEEVRARLPEPPEGSRLERTAALRYLGQGFEVEVPVGTPADPGALARDFHAAHEREYGFSLPGAAVEWVELRVRWERDAPDWGFPDPEGEGTSRGSTTVWELEGEAAVRREAALLERDHLAAGQVVAGPAVLLETDATLFVPSGQVATVAPGGVLRIRRPGGAS